MAKEWIAYEKQLKDERWLMVREQVLARDFHMCTKCFKSNDLQVHHKYYETGCMAWEYPLEALQTLCRGCHAKEHGVIPEYTSRVRYEYRNYGESRPVLHISHVMKVWVEALLNARENGKNTHD
jgi:5-methylcytosine-specific restriction endonuclease McrA